MNMDEVIARINALAKKAKSEGLTAEETAERDKLRRIYIDSVKANLTGQLDNTYILRPEGYTGTSPEISEKESFLWENCGISARQTRRATPASTATAQRRRR